MNVSGVESDDALVARAMTGDEVAFAALVERYSRLLYLRAYRLLRDACEAEEATQETFVRAYVKLASYRTGTSFSAWLVAIATHWCIDHQRERARRERKLAALRQRQDPGEADDWPETDALRRERSRLVSRWVLGLPPKYRQVVALHYYDELNYAEIGAALGQPVTTVRMRLHRARRLLQASGHPE